MNLDFSNSSKHLLNGNKIFLNNYESKINKDWYRFYFQYDYIKKEIYNLLDFNMENSENKQKIQKFDVLLCNEIIRIDTFLSSIINQVRGILNKLSLSNHNDDDDDFAKASIEITLRFLFEKTLKIKTFYKLNCFAICRIAKKLENILDGMIKQNDYNSNSNIKLAIEYDNNNDNFDKDFVQWKKMNSYKLYKNNIIIKQQQIELINNDIINLYTNIFRNKFQSLAINELEFPKQKSGQYHNRDALIGFKLGLVLIIILWITSDSIFIKIDNFFWINPGLYIYSAVSNIILYRFLWSINVYYWARYNINYITLLKLSTKVIGDVKFIIDESSTLLLLLTASILIFFRVHNDHYKHIDNATLNLSPFILVIVIAVYLFYQSFLNKKVKSRGLINFQVLKRCLSVPFVRVQFRDNYTADVLTSFTKIISDTLYGSCWVISGSFLSNDKIDSNSIYESFGANGINCTGKGMSAFVGIVVIIPLWIRAMQCIRNFYDHNCNVYAHIQNLIKYLLSISVVVVGLVSKDKFDDDFDIYDICYFILIAFTSLIKWYWDVIMDWGLFENNNCFKYSCFHKTSLSNSSQSYLFLRDNLMYPNHYNYYIAIFLDLIGRFLWTAALVPNTYKLIPNGPLLSILLGINIYF